MLPPQAARHKPNPEHANRLSRDFASSAIAYLTAIRQWRDAVETLVGIGAPESRKSPCGSSNIVTALKKAFD